MQMCVRSYTPPLFNSLKHFYTSYLQDDITSSVKDVMKQVFRNRKNIKWNQVQKEFVEITGEDSI
jgi:hypothetical protein